MTKFPFQAIVFNPTAEDKAAQLEWCRSIGKHNKAWIVYHGNTHGKVFDNYYFPNIATWGAFREKFGVL